MSSHISIGNAFTKKFYNSSTMSGVSGYLSAERLATNPARKWGKNFIHEGVPADCRRIYLLIQNQSDGDFRVWFDTGTQPDMGFGHGPTEPTQHFLLKAGSTLTLDNYNGGVVVEPDNGIATGVVLFSESFA